MRAGVCQRFEFWAMRMVNVGVALNPFVYGAMKTTYRRAYLYLVRLSLHYLSLTWLPRPQSEYTDYTTVKTTYPRAYLYLVRVTLHYLSLTWLPRPQSEYTD